ncbi:unnamed protein product, partial [marine sediment metagenome]
PYTTEGIPARSSMIGFNVFCTTGDENSARNIAQARPNGIPTTRAPAVTMSEPMIIDKIPK